jgi:POT family proton-dependent oligopeptide transporter
MPRPDKYQTAPVDTAGMPPGIPYIVGNEAAERFSFYGMRGILVVFMTKHLLDAAGQPAYMSDAEASSYYHLFNAAVYFFPLFGAIISDALFGKYRTILWLSIVYCLGHLALSLNETRVGLFVGLSLIAIGSGGIKPCVSANVGDQFGERNKGLIEKVYSIFYLAINLGAFCSSILTPVLLSEYGPRVAFAVPGILMFLATVVFWMGRDKFVHVPAAGFGFIRNVFTSEGISAILRLGLIYLFVAVFWALYDQTGSRWVIQAEHMNRYLLGREWNAAQIQAVNPLLILILVPIFSWVVYPLTEKVIPLPPLRRVTIGFFLTVAAFAISGLIETRIVAGATPSIWWQILAYVVLTSAEVMVSVTCLEFSYTQAPPAMKSFIMSLYLLSVTAGNLLASAVNHEMEARSDVQQALEGANYYWFFTLLMLVAACAFIPVAMLYRGKTYIQGTDVAAE